MKVAISILLSFLATKAAWMILPVLICPPVAALLGWSFYKEGIQNGLCESSIRKLVYLAPLVVAICSFIWGMYLLNTEYNP